MPILITEFMDERAVAKLAARHDVLYDPKLVDDAKRLHAEVGSADPTGCSARTMPSSANSRPVQHIA